ncbi:hypothetical protein ES703_86980 [subsurface metagenome]
MEELAGEVGRLYPIYRVARHRVADSGEVNPNLVGAPRLRLHLQQGIVPDIFNHMIVGSRLFTLALSHHRHALSVMGVTPNRRLNNPLLRGEMPLDQHQIGFGHRAGFKLSNQI